MFLLRASLLTVWEHFKVLENTGNSILGSFKTRFSGEIKIIPCVQGIRFLPAPGFVDASAGTAEKYTFLVQANMISNLTLSISPPHIRIALSITEIIIYIHLRDHRRFHRQKSLRGYDRLARRKKSFFVLLFKQQSVVYIFSCLQPECFSFQGDCKV